MRLIDADALKIDYIVPSTTTGTPCYLYISKEQIDCAPTIEAEPKRGRWVDDADIIDASFDLHKYRCSNCNSYADKFICGHDWYTGFKPNYCPNCGAKMEEQE